MTFRNDQTTSVDINSPGHIKTEQNALLTTNTLGIAGYAMKGPAFVPKVIRTFESDRSVSGTLNTFEDTFGKMSELYYINNSIASVNEWFTQGGEQVVFTRVLGLGKTGIPESNGIVSGSGFTVGENIVSGSSEEGFKGSNPFSSGSNAGRTLFITSYFTEKNYNNTTNPGNNYRISSLDAYFTQIGFNTGEDCEVLTHTIFCPSGSNIALENPAEINSTLFVENLTDDAFQNLNDFNDERRYLDNNLKMSYGENYLNYKPRHILEKGHVVYGKYLPQSNVYGTQIKQSLVNNAYHEIRSGSNFNGTPEYENFISPFKTAKTPWIVSQPTNRDGLDKNREDLINKCEKLFRFHAIDDGKIGNKYRIKITPQRLGDNKEKTWSKFSIEIKYYNKKENIFKSILKYTDLNLNPESDKYICRIFGTEHTYYDVKLGKVVTDGHYRQTNNHLRVEINKDIDFQDLKVYELMPCGFVSYPEINTTGLGANIKQLPVTYTQNLPRQTTSITKISEDSSWGVLFDETSLVEDVGVIIGDSTFSYRMLKSVESSSDKISSFYNYTKYFQDSFLGNDSTKNVWNHFEEEESNTNSFFHLERILYPNATISNGSEKWAYAIYRRDGKAISELDTTLHTGNPADYNYINVEEMLKGAGSDDSINSKFLSFEMFTFGGFDGTNILDHDKYLLNQTAFVKELENEEKSSISESPTPTYSAYSIAHKIMSDDSNCEIDILSFPDVGHHTFNKEVSIVAGEKQKYLAVLNVPEYTSTGILKNYEFYDIDFNEPDITLQQNLKNNIRESLKSGISSSLDSLIQNYYNNKFTINVGNTCEGVLAPDRLNNIEHSKFVVFPATILIRSLASILNKPADSVMTFSPSLMTFSMVYNSTFNDQNNNDYSRVIVNSLQSNLNYIVPKSNSLNVNSSNTAIYQRNSLSRYAHNTRILLDINKNIKYFLYTEDVLFNNSGNILRLVDIINIKLEQLLTDYKNRNYIKDYYLKRSTGLTSIESTDLLNNILKTKIAISLYGSKDDSIREISLAETINIAKNNLTENLDIDIILSAT